jgi:hypothetical protein
MVISLPFFKIAMMIQHSQKLLLQYNIFPEVSL